MQEELRARIATSGSAAQLGPPDVVLAGVQALFVLIFNPGKSNEGVYTLQGKTSPASSYVLAFEQTDEVRSLRLYPRLPVPMDSPLRLHL
jgi:hypothetical protein